MESLELLLKKHKDLVYKNEEANCVKSILNNKFNKNTSRSLYKKLHDVTKKLINNYLDDFLKLLDDDDILIAGYVAEVTYPVLPNKSIKILQKYYESLDNPLDKMKIREMINGLKNNQIFFVTGLKEYYGVEDLNSLNREH